MARCPECNAKLTVPEEVKRWDRIPCQACGVDLEVLSTSPLELEAVYEIDEDDDLLSELEEDDDGDWEDDDDDDSDDDDDDSDEW